MKMSTMFPTSHTLVLAKHFEPVIQSRLEVGKLNDEWTSIKADAYSGRDWEKTPLWTGPRSTVCTPGTVTSSP